MKISQRPKWMKTLNATAFRNGSTVQRPGAGISVEEKKRLMTATRKILERHKPGRVFPTGYLANAYGVHRDTVRNLAVETRDAMIREGTPVPEFGHGGPRNSYPRDIQKIMLRCVRVALKAGAGEIFTRDVIAAVFAEKGAVISLDARHFLGKLIERQKERAGKAVSLKINDDGANRLYRKLRASQK